MIGIRIFSAVSGDKVVNNETAGLDKMHFNPLSVHLAGLEGKCRRNNST